MSNINRAFIPCEIGLLRTVEAISPHVGCSKAELLGALLYLFDFCMATETSALRQNFLVSWFLGFFRFSEGCSEDDFLALLEDFRLITKTDQPNVFQVAGIEKRLNAKTTKAETSRKNGALGGRPPKNPKTQTKPSKTQENLNETQENPGKPKPNLDKMRRDEMRVEEMKETPPPPPSSSHDSTAEAGGDSLSENPSNKQESASEAKTGQNPSNPTTSNENGSESKPDALNANQENEKNIELIQKLLNHPKAQWLGGFSVPHRKRLSQIPKRIYIDVDGLIDEALIKAELNPAGYLVKLIEEAADQPLLPHGVKVEDVDELTTKLHEAFRLKTGHSYTKQAGDSKALVSLLASGNKPEEIIRRWKNGAGLQYPSVGNFGDLQKFFNLLTKPKGLKHEKDIAAGEAFEDYWENIPEDEIGQIDPVTLKAIKK